MGIKTAGALKPLQYIVESNFGVLPSGQLSYGGKLQTQSQTNSHDIETFAEDGSRTVGLKTWGQQEAGFSVELGTYLDSGDYSWTYLLKLAMGESGAARGDIDSFSALFEAAPDQFYLYRGCKVNSLTLAASGVGKAMMATMDAVAMIGEEPATTKAQLLSNADATIPALNPVTHNKYPEMSLDSVVIPAMSYSITIGNNLVQKEGIVDGKALKGGSLIYPGDIMSVSMEYTVASTSLFWDRLKMAETDDFTVTHQIGGYELTFEHCWIPGDDMPSRTQTGYDETITFNAANISWEAVQ